MFFVQCYNNVGTKANHTLYNDILSKKSNLICDRPKANEAQLKEEFP